MTDSFCKDSKRHGNSFGCQYCHKAFNGEFIGNNSNARKLVNCCYFLPYWGKDIKQIPSCPKYNRDGTENKSTLRSVCHVAK